MNTIKPKPKPLSPRQQEMMDSINRIYKTVAADKRSGRIKNKIAKKFKECKIKKPPKPKAKKKKGKMGR